MRPVSVANLMTPFENGVRVLFAQHRALSAPITDLLTVAVCGIYAVQAAQTAIWGAPSVFEATNYVYLRAPWLAWPLSPLLHGGLAHVVPNVVTLFVFGRVAEAHLPFRQFGTMAFVAAAGSIAALAGWGVVFGSGSNVAVYGISGVVFAAGGFAVLHFPRHDRVTDLELLTVLFGLCAVALVAAESLVALVLLSPATINVGHAVGLLVGLGTAAVSRVCPDTCDSWRSKPDEHDERGPRGRDPTGSEES
ncbi:rhomboid family intramembrane serine protease [Halobellus rarus]|uniref:Rhomboid family intramembrane serine protease n=1 Tax=Halobellus rarus TaxID=1126237 RepID=A0ABD6CKK3_9EURY|nr:rhomboid family intramembrane serine protease [Halobellus rarus]